MDTVPTKVNPVCCHIDSFPIVTFITLPCIATVIAPIMQWLIYLHIFLLFPVKCPLCISVCFADCITKLIQIDTDRKATIICHLRVKISRSICIQITFKFAFVSVNFVLDKMFLYVINKAGPIYFL